MTVTEEIVQNIESVTTVENSAWNPWFTLILGLGLVVVLYEYWFRNTREYKLCKNIPSPPTLPIVGNAHLVVGLTNAQIYNLGNSYLERYGETLCAWLGPIPVVFLTNPVDLEIVLSSTKLLEKTYEYMFFKPWFGDGILISKGHHWRHHRKMIAPTFHQSILKSFVPKFVLHSKTVVERMAQQMGKEFDVHDYMSQTTVEMLLTTAMGVKKIPDSNKSLEYAKAVMDMCDIIHKRQVKFFYRIDALFKFTKASTKYTQLLNDILSLNRNVVAERMSNFNAEANAIVEAEKDAAERKQQAKSVGLRDDLDDIDENDVGSKKHLALLDAMMVMSKDPEIEWTDKDVMDEVNTIMFEGHDTTAGTASFALLLLGIHKDIQEKVYAEQKAIFGEKITRDCTFADTMEMKYLEQVILETLRMYPPVPVIARKADYDVKLASGPYTIPKGTTIALLTYVVHRNAKYFPNPHKFDPDNFLPERTTSRHYYSFIPFSAGPRSCVGRKYGMLQLKILLSTILRQYTVHCNQTEDDFILQADVTLKLENGFKLQLTPRQHTAATVA